ncbi:MAG: crossover junction endodeoxyribonuclease RuvC [bacterium]
MRVLGVDTSLRSSGVAVVEERGSALVAVDYGTIINPPRRSLSDCLKCLHEDLSTFIDRHKPEQAAVEGLFYCKNVKTATTLAHARGVAIAVCTLAGLPVFEYAPRSVKQAVVGYGAAEKEQVRRMVMAILALKEEPGEDAGDALAIAVCHLHSRIGHKALAPRPI